MSQCPPSAAQSADPPTPLSPAVLPPALTVALSATPYNGTVLSLQGSATLNTTMVDTPVTVKGGWRRHNSQGLTSSEDSTSPYSTVLPFDPLGGGDGGDYVYSVAVEPSDPTFVLSSMANQTFPLEVQPYPELEVLISMEGGVCATDRIATLTGSMALLDRTAANRTLTYTWRDPSGQVVSPKPQHNSTLEVEVVEANLGDHTLTVCLSIPASGIVNHCSNASYTLCILGENTTSLSVNSYMYIADPHKST